MNKYTQSVPSFRAGMPLALAVAVAVGATSVSQPVAAQRGSAALLEEVIVTARKREEGAQDVPLSISAFNSNQIEALKVRDLTNLAVGMPNVALDDVGTTRGTANFAIRGLGINSSIPSIDPTVGVFVNGVYLGVNNGIIFDVFDLESIEVLRGPQGILFGRNVTGGAILMNTKKPGETLDVTLRGAVDTGGDGGINTYLMGSIGGPVTDTLGLKLTAYWNDDEGWHENQFDGSDVQAIEQMMVRGTLVWAPTDRAELVVRYENTDIEGDGPVAQSHTNGSGVPGTPFNAKRDSFDANYDLVGFQDNETDFLTAEFNYDVDFGDGTITALYGWRDSEAHSASDIDAQPVALFHAPADLVAEQNSFELRYNGQFGNANITTGVYWFENDIEYHERRDLLGALTASVTGGALSDDISFQIQDGGGLYDVETLAFFAAMDYDLTDRLSFTVGARWSSEEKSAEIATLALNTNVLDIPGTIGSGTPVYANPITGTDTRCNIVSSNNCALDFKDDETWDTFAPKIGFGYALSDATQLYAHWSRGFRSGGYNLRNTSPTAAPGPFDEEQVDSYEIGYKSQQDWGRLNAAVFYNDIGDMQREVNLADATSGVVQIIDNTADATIWGLEIDGTFALTDDLLLLASMGYIDASYDSVRFDLNGDGMVDGKDKDLDLPRAPEWTWSVGLNYDMSLGDWGFATARINYANRDEAFYTDNNLGYILEQDILDAGLDFYSNSGSWVFSLYGRNLLDEVKHGGDTQLPDVLGPVALGGTFSPLAKGRVYGAEITYNFSR
ncbi:TonB-dependent receptor [Pseudohalioglobus sediminis]|uniref:TonB-dependent receptor n=1 Tax=Pseudohalioglobus sediminis TaxID=2606449 RepID=A0A5B0WZN6_9GAMM|nr:TonB-dependent receptor [Pseudohalioglobus sediminis]KAA1191865.1 TonB-dependent receptor [Pseudohalioglobus sediminis]